MTQKTKPLTLKATRMTGQPITDRSHFAMVELLALEGLLLTCIGLMGGWCLHLVTLWGLRDWVQSQWGLSLMMSDVLASQGLWTLVVCGCGLLASLLPAVWAYRLSWHDGLSPRT